MAYFQWGADLVIDNGPIDDDHRQLVDLVNELHTATSQGLGQTVVAGILNQLLASTQEHLLREEQAMQSVGFEHLKRHRAGHAAFVDGLRDLQRKYEAGSITVAAQLSTLLRDWLSLHIRRSDKELALLLLRRDAKAPGLA